MKKKKILVTGACGYIGKHTVESLLNQGYDVVAADIFDYGIDGRALKYIGDIFDGDTNIYQKLGCPDVCLHLAWKDGFNHNSDYHMGHLSDHYIFIKNMINGGLKHIAVLGSMHEIGYHEGMIKEGTKANPSSFYGISKLALRQACELLTRNRDDVVFQWLRAYYIYGDDRLNKSIFAKIIMAAEEGKETFPFTTGKNQYDFISVNELAKQIVAVITQDEIQGIIECCSGKPISLANKVEEFIKNNHYSIKLEYGAYPDRPYDSPIIYGDASKIVEIMKKKK